MLRVIEYFAKSLKVIQNATVEWGVFHWNYVCISYSFWDIQRQRMSWSLPGVELVAVVGVIENGTVQQIIYRIRLSIGRPWHCKYSSMLYHFRVIWRWIIVTLKSGP